MKQLKVILVTVMVLLLQACGGGGTPQADPRNPMALYTSAPSAITMSGDAAPASFLIRGGVPPYGASTSNAGVAAATVNGAD